METKLDSRQGQFPATFPDTFKDFFAMMSEDEDHIDLFSNLLEDKVIPRANRLSQRRCGGSLRCTNTATTNVGRSNSFRMNRPVSSYCKHIKYCCLHQKHYSQNFLDYRRSIGDGCSSHDDEDDLNLQSPTQLITNSNRHLNQTTRQTIIERSFDGESYDESDTLSTSSSTPTIPQYSRKQPLSSTKHLHAQHHQSLHNQTTKGFHCKEILPRIVQQQQQKHKQHQQLHHQQQQHQPQQQQHHHHHQQQQQQQQQTGLRADNITITTKGFINDGSGTSVMGGGSSASSIVNNDCRGIVTSRKVIGANNPNVGGGVGSNINNVKMNCDRNNLPAPTISSHQNNSYTIGGNGISSPSSKISHMDLNLSKTLSSSQLTINKFCDKLNICPPTRANSIRLHKSPILNRRRSSSIAATLLTTANKASCNPTDEFSSSWAHSTLPQSNTRDRISHTKSSAINNKPKKFDSGVLTFQEAMSGAVSPQYTTTVNNMPRLSMGGSSTASAIDETFFCGGAGGSSANITQFGHKQKQRLRTSSMPAESRKPRLAETRRTAIHGADMDMEYYRLRSFSITSHGICNLGDSLRSRRSRSINSVTSTGTSNSGRERHNSNSSRNSAFDNPLTNEEAENVNAGNAGVIKSSIPAYKIAMLGSSSVGKTALTYQFTTSDYICAYDLSLDDDYGQKTVSVLVDGVETDLEIIDHPACEMSTESFCSTYNLDLFVVVYSVVDRNSFKAAEKVLHYLKDNEMLLARGAILVGNKTDLERHREVTRHSGRKLAKEIACKFIETSSGLDHNVDELLVGIVAQVKLNPKRIRNLSEKDRQRLNLSNTIQKHRRIGIPIRKIIKQASIGKQSSTSSSPPQQAQQSSSAPQQSSFRTTTTTTESILKMGESESEDIDEINNREQDNVYRDMSRINLKTKDGSSANSSPKSRQSYDRNRRKGSTATINSDENYFNDDPNDGNINDDTNNKRTCSRLTNRTKIFLTSVLKFKRAINLKRRSSSNCSDLFVI